MVSVRSSWNSSKSKHPRSNSASDDAFGIAKPDNVARWTCHRASRRRPEEPDRLLRGTENMSELFLQARFAKYLRRRENGSAHL